MLLGQQDNFPIIRESLESRPRALFLYARGERSVSVFIAQGERRGHAIVCWPADWLGKEGSSDTLAGWLGVYKVPIEWATYLLVGSRPGCSR